MKKKSVVILTAMIMASVGGTALAASVSPFDDVPAKHWAYEAVNQLAKDGVVSGYGDRTFRGDKTITRYEMAAIVAKAISNTNKAAVDKATAEDKAALERLKVEFSAELSNLGVRVANLEKKASSFKWWGDARIRYQGNYDNTARDGETQKRIQDRLRLGFYGEMDDSLSVLGRIKAEDTRSQTDQWASDSVHNDSGNHGSMNIDLLGLNWQKGALNVGFGRIPVTIGQGVIWSDNPIDGIYGTYKFDNVSLSAGYGDLSAANWAPHTVNAFLANLSVTVSKDTNITIGHLGTANNDNTAKLKDGDWTQHNGAYALLPYKLKQYSYGFNTKLQDKLNLLVEGVTNNASGLPSDAQKNGWWSRLTYGQQDWYKQGTYEVYFDYMKLGNWSVDSTGWSHILNTAGGNALGGDGEKGYGVGIKYMLAKQTQLEGNYYKVKPYDTSKTGYDSYKDVFNVNLNFSF